MARRPTAERTLSNDDLWSRLVEALTKLGSNVAEPFTQDCGTDENESEETYWDADSGRNVTITVRNQSETCKIEVTIEHDGAGKPKVFDIKLGGHRSTTMVNAKELKIACYGAETEKAGRHKCKGSYKIIFH
jgi:hypothetical protein